MGKCISTAEKLGKELRDSYERWNHILQNGAGDPFWKDGANMNLVRNHIIHYKRQCEAELLPEEYPEEYLSLIHIFRLRPERSGFFRGWYLQNNS